MNKKNYIGRWEKPFKNDQGKGTEVITVVDVFNDNTIKTLERQTIPISELRGFKKSEYNLYGSPFANVKGLQNQVNGLVPTTVKKTEVKETDAKETEIKQDGGNLGTSDTSIQVNKDNETGTDTESLLDKSNLVQIEPIKENKTIDPKEQIIINSLKLIKENTKPIDVEITFKNTFPYDISKILEIGKATGLSNQEITIHIIKDLKDDGFSIELLELYIDSIIRAIQE